MNKRIHLKNRKRFKKIDKLIITIILIVIFSFVSLNRINRSFTPIIVETAELEINKFSTTVITKAISQVLEDKIDMDNLFSTIIANDGSVQTIDFNSVIVNQVLNVATTTVQKNLQLLENGELENIGLDLSNREVSKLRKGIIAEIPVGVVFKNSILANIGPKIPIRLHYYGDVNSNITTKVTSYGINNALVEVGVHLEMTAQIILPLITKKMNLKCDIPLAIKMIQGSIPNYYGNGLLKDSSIYSIPFE